MNWIYTIVAFALGLPITYFIWDKALHRKREKMLKRRRNEAEVLKKDKVCRQREILQLKSEHESILTNGTTSCWPNENRKNKKKRYLRRKDELSRSIQRFG